MIAALHALFSDRLIEYADAIPFDECKILNDRKLAEVGFSPKSAIVFAIPYYAGAFSSRNLSLYAVARDYHLFFRRFSEELSDALSALFPNACFAAFADNSPIDEREAAAKAGLGVMGKNGLLLTKRYGPYVFLAEILTDLAYEKIGTLDAYSVKLCEGCLACLDACPKKEVCLSALTQKKGALSKEEEEEILSLGSVWGCDVCQSACPYAAHADVTPLAFFKEALIPHLTVDILDAMSEEEFKARAYSWRGRKTILRNLRLFEE